MEPKLVGAEALKIKKEDAEKDLQDEEVPASTANFTRKSVIEEDKHYSKNMDPNILKKLDAEEEKLLPENMDPNIFVILDVEEEKRYQRNMDPNFTAKLDVEGDELCQKSMAQNFMKKLDGEEGVQVGMKRKKMMRMIEKEEVVVVAE